MNAHTTIRRAISSAKLRRIFGDSETVFFIGAGGSYSCGLPQGIPAVQAILRAVLSRIEASKDVQEAINELSAPWENKWPAWPRFEVAVGLLAQHLPDAPRALMAMMEGRGRSSCHLGLAQLSPKQRVWLTTNFDDQIELALEGRRFIKYVDRASLRRMSKLGTHHHVIKLHGDASSRDLRKDSVVTIDQLLRAFPSTLCDRLLGLLAGKPLAFIGYSASDPDLIDLVTKLVQLSPTVVWVGLGNLPERVARVLEGHPEGYFLSGGFDNAISAPLHLSFQLCVNPENTWENELLVWVARQSRLPLTRFLADFLISIGSDRGRKLALTLLPTAYPGKGDDYDFFSRKVDILLKTTPRPIARIRAALQLANRRQLKAKKTASERVKWLTRIAMINQRTGNYSEALVVLKQAQKLAQGSRSYHDKFVVSQAFGRLAVFSGSNLMAKGTRALQRARQFALRANNPIGATDAMEDLAIGLMRGDRAREAEQLLRRCGAVENEIGSPTRLVNWKLNLAEALRIQWKFDEALELLAEARLVVQTTGDFEHLAKILANSGLVALCAGHPTEAHNWMQQCKAAVARSPIDEVSANVSYNEGWLRLLLGLWAEAIPHFQIAARGYLKTAGPERAVGAFGCIGWCYLELNDTHRATQQLSQVTRLGFSAAGLHKGEFDLLRWALREPRQLGQLESDFRRMHDIFFRGLAYLIRNKCGMLSVEEREHCEMLMVSAATEARIPYLLARAENILGRRKMAALARLAGNKLKYRNLDSYLQEMKAIG